MNKRRYSSFELRVAAVKAVRKGVPIVQVCEAYDIDRSTLYRWRSKIGQKRKFDALQRAPVSGRPRLLSHDQVKYIKGIILNPASKYGFETDFWTCRRLIQAIKRELKFSVSQPTMWRMLREAELTYKKPERQYFQASEKLRRKWLEEELPQILETAKKYRAILYFQDEANISLTANLGKTWGPKGKRVVQKVTGKRGGVAAMSAISRSRNLIFTLHEKRIASPEVIHFLAQMLKHHPRRHLVVVMDGAKPHVSRMTKSFIKEQKRLHVFYLPSYSPDYNADEGVWNYLKYQELKSHQAKNKKELKRLARKKLRKMAADPNLLQGIFFRCYIAELLN